MTHGPVTDEGPEGRPTRHANINGNEHPIINDFNSGNGGLLARDASCLVWCKTKTVLEPHPQCVSCTLPSLSAEPDFLTFHLGWWHAHTASDQWSSLANMISGPHMFTPYIFLLIM